MPFPTLRALGRATAALAAAVLAVPLFAVAASAQDFSDIPPSHKFYKEITWAAQEGITNGLSDGRFGPNSSVTRDAFAVYLYELAGSPSVTLPSKSPFKDVTPSTTFYRQMVWMDQQGISNGYADGTFRPKDNINRDAMAVFMYRYLGEPSFTPPSRSPFTDMTPRSKFYKEVAWMDQSGISGGYSDGTFRPRDDVTRGATIVFLYRASGSPDVDLPAIVPTSFTVKGAGFGHGVGMSQYGAQAMALEGYSANSILQKYYTGTSVSTVAADRNLKVEVFGSGTDSRNSVDLIARGKWRLSFYDVGATPADTWYGNAGERLKVTRDGNEVEVERPDGRTFTAERVILNWEGTRDYQSGSSVKAYAELYKRGTSTRASHGTYRHGQLRVSVPSESYPRLIISNQVKLNTEYLYGIAEMPSSWDPDALQAQAIVARGYALRQMGNFSDNCDCHIYDDTRDQQFSGWQKENEGTNAYYGKRWVAAVDATNASSGTTGKVLTSGGSIAQTYYYSSSGGQTENSEDIWSAALPYLRSVDDPWSETSINPNRAWTQTMSQSKARSVFGLADVVSIRVVSRTAGGSDAAATKVTATSSTGKTSSITGAERIRSRLANGKSPWLWSFTPNH
ncbi:SpoIID/LytB domain-containing protein [Demequina muriae]|uniref:SpoIID/LytB domain-containing protein n=1 Tax=Demequina muriae TaxID=3051664 RepID=A0ABT8GG77_9MICO|nr:SpoIID/LytB domain-containing protein [Demequina sp. EGI L300058]MDN4480438.1 SpoIID/LytB domain-containing protein [Demequina sp. EGI L300058]